MRSLGLGLRAGHSIAAHAHDWAQVVYAIEGVMRVRAGAGTWVVPSHRAAWLPPGVEHELHAHGDVQLRTIYLSPQLATKLPDACCVLSVSALLRELILEIHRVGMLLDGVPQERRLARVLVDRLRVTRQAPLELPWPRDPRALAVARAAHDALGRAVGLAELVVGSGASVRTIERLFVRETGMTFGRWRQQARLLGALALLAAGSSVTTTSLSVGFASPSAFIAMFRRTLGATPSRYFDADTPAQTFGSS